MIESWDRFFVAETAAAATLLGLIIGNLVALLPILIGGVLVFTGGEAGFYLVAIGMCLCIVKAVSEGWVFLVEIDR